MKKIFFENLNKKPRFDFGADSTPQLIDHNNTNSSQSSFTQSISSLSRPRFDFDSSTAPREYSQNANIPAMVS